MDHARQYDIAIVAFLNRDSSYHFSFKTQLGPKTCSNFNELQFNIQDV